MNKPPALTAFESKHFTGALEVLNFKLLNFEHSGYPQSAQVGQKVVLVLIFVDNQVFFDHNS